MNDITYRLALLVACLMLAGGPALASDADTAGDAACLECHDDPAEAMADEAAHGDVPCLDCHVGADERRHRRGLEPVDCTTCHEDAADDHAAGVHAVSETAADDWQTPTCRDCHGDGHDIHEATNPLSPVHAGRQAETCGTCHGDGRRTAAGVRTIRPVEAYSQSAHAAAVGDGDGGAVCSDCHSAHRTLPADDPLSSVYRSNVPDTCGDCHRRITREYQRSIHGLAMAEGSRDSPVCTDCHGEHRILAASDAGSPTSATNIPIQICGPCHSDLRLTEKYGLPADQVPAYKDSYHGLASRGGVQRVAHCASCHGVHSILPSSHPDSQVHPENLAETCGACHPGAGRAFAIGPVHVLADSTPNVVARWIRSIYIPLIWIVVLGMLLHNGLDLVRKTRNAQPYRRRAPEYMRVKQRMSVTFRLTHGLAAISFIVLAVTGFALKYPESAWVGLLRMDESNAELRGLLHRIAAVGLMGATVFHFVHVAVSKRARGAIAAMLPRVADVREFVHRQAYNLGRRPDPPAPVRVGYIEKVEYWAALWGTLVTAGTGLLLWFENFTLSTLPGWVPEAATVLHFYEAVLAVLAIIIWHFYSVLFDPVVYPMDTTWLTGKPPYARAEERGEAVDERDESPKQPPPQ